MRKVVDEIIKGLEKGTSLNSVKKEVSKKYRLKDLPSNIEIMNELNEKEREKYGKYFLSKPTRTGSGVAPLAIMCKPHKCPHGKCVMCPGGLNSIFGNVPQSYTGDEPATARGVRAKFDSYLQVFNRLEQYVVLGIIPEKIELIIMGGTFLSTSKSYQDKFVKFSFKAMNDFSKMFFNKVKFNFTKFKEFFELPGDVGDEERVKKVQNKIKKFKGKCELEKEQRKNENSMIKCVALAIETRPDVCGEREINQMLKLGCTRMEIGVQSIYDGVLKKINRGHSVEDSVSASKLLRDSLLKINFHCMPGLASFKRDVNMFKILFSDQRFKPDSLKIYPCIVIKGTKLYDMWIRGKYKPLTTENAIKLISKVKEYVPEYCRIQRIQRDISSHKIEAGVDRTNLRQMVKTNCRCIRCREPKDLKFDDYEIKRYVYEASEGVEVFVSAECDDKILGFCRVRIPFEPFRKEITNKCVGIRELHVYGGLTGLRKKGNIQHRGIGKRLLKEVESIAKENGKNKIVVISGVGARGYYKKFGFKRDGIYMSKVI